MDYDTISADVFGAGLSGFGINLLVVDIAPEAAVDRATARGDISLQPPPDKPHGLCEAYILSPSGYAWVPSRPLSD